MKHWKQTVRRVPVYLAFLCLLMSPAIMTAQQSSQNSEGQNQPASPSGNGSASSSTQQQKQKPSDENAFPVEQSSAAAKSASSSTASPQAGNQATGNDGQTKGDGAARDKAKQNKQSPAKDNPFPEDQSAAAAKSNGGQSQQPSSGGSPGSSSAAGQYSSSDQNLPPPDLGEGTLRQNKKMDSFTRDQTQDGRIQDDLNVADYYMKNGNYRGAYSRYDDALQYDPQNDTALFGRAFAMCKQNLTSDAMAQFKSYAKSNPQGKYALKAEKLLAHPNKCMHNF